MSNAKEIAAVLENGPFRAEHDGAWWTFSWTEDGEVYGWREPFDDNTLASAGPFGEGDEHAAEEIAAFLAGETR